MLTPLNDTSMTRPGPRRFAPDGTVPSPACSVSFSGRTPTVTVPDVRCARERGTRMRRPATSTPSVSPAPSSTGPTKRLDWPRKFATNTVDGSS